MRVTYVSAVLLVRLVRRPLTFGASVTPSVALDFRRQPARQLQIIRLWPRGRYADPATFPPDADAVNLPFRAAGSARTERPNAGALPENRDQRLIPGLAR
jgi:hypothetical protein